MALVIPSRGKATETAKLLLELADSQWDVKTTTEFGGDHGVAFIVPDDLHDRYLEATGHGKGEESPAPKRRGRPRKAAPEPETDTADDESDEE